MTLTEFLLARIADDEAVARAHIANWTDEDGDGGVSLFMELRADNEYAWMDIGAGRVLAECEAKRRIVEELEETQHTMGGLEEEGDFEAALGWADAARALERPVRLLAAVYADHPDYDEAWRP